MLFCYFSVCSSYKKFYVEIVKLKKIFKWNFYPEIFIDRCIKIFKTNLPR